MINLNIISNYVQNEYLRAVIIFIVALFILRFLFYIASKFILKFSKKTQTNFDDLVFEKTSKPITWLVALFSFWLALSQLTFTTNVSNIVSNFFNSGFVILLGYMAYVITDLIIIYGWGRITAKSKIHLDESLSSIIHTFLRVSLVALGVIYILDLWGVQIGPLLAGLGIAGLAVALALQPTLSNIFGGLSMILDKSLRIGDWVVLEDGVWGTVEHIGVRSTKIKTFDNELITYPNSKLADNRIHNVALPEPKTRVVVPFSVAYGSNIEKVKKIVMKEVKTINHIVSDPEPFVFFLEMANSSLNFKAFFFVDSFKNRYASLDEANTKIYNALNKAGISIPFPQMDVHLKKK